MNDDNVLTTLLKGPVKRFVDEVYHYEPRYDSYRIRSDYEHIGGETLRKLIERCV